MTEFVKSLVEIQHELKVPKGQTNTFGKYKYRSAEDILEAVKPLNAKKGLLLTLFDEPILIGDWHYIKATATITNGEETKSVTAYARESITKKGMDDSQITGTASSYARKYALNGLYLIDDTKDADTDEYQNQNKNAQKQQEPPAQQSTNKMTVKQKDTIVDKANKIAAKTGVEMKDVWTTIQEKFGFQKTLIQLTNSEASKVIEYLISQE